MTFLPAVFCGSPLAASTLHVLAEWIYRNTHRFVHTILKCVIYIYIYRCSYLYFSLDMYIYMHIYIYTYVYTYTHAHMRTYIHTHTYVHTHAYFSRVRRNTGPCFSRKRRLLEIFFRTFRNSSLSLVVRRCL